MKWTAEQIPDLTGKTVIVTGANSGLGFEATKKFAEKNAEVVMACRTLKKAEKARREIKEELEDPNLELMEIDLADLESVEVFAESFRENHESLEILCNNAGLMAIPRRETVDGFEMQLGVNHLGHFALTGHLIDMLIESKGRIVNQSSMAHEGSEIDFDDLMSEKSYSKWGAYGQSKLANLLFTYELDRKLDEADADVEAVACHPGVSDTNLFRKGPEMTDSKIKQKIQGIFSHVIGQSAEKGALPMIYAATEDLEGGEYIGPSGFRNMRGLPEKQESSDASHNKRSQEKLWYKSEELTSVEYELGIY